MVLLLYTQFLPFHKEGSRREATVKPPLKVEEALPTSVIKFLVIVSNKLTRFPGVPLQQSHTPKHKKKKKSLAIFVPNLQQKYSDV
jgi:hypothetical protein